jgi:hypothetical protein
MKYLFVIMMKIQHQMRRHNRRDIHATNHARCAERSKAKRSKVRKQSEANWSETEKSQMCPQQGLPCRVLQPYRARKEAPRRGLGGKRNSLGRSKGAMEHGLDQTGMDDQGMGHPSPKAE